MPSIRWTVDLRTVDRQSSTVWTLADSWIWARLQQLVRDVERLFQNFQYGEAGRQIYEFIWSDFADWYVEIAKEQLQKRGHKSADRRNTGARVRYFPAPAASLHAVCDRRDSGVICASALSASSLKGYGRRLARSVDRCHVARAA